MTIDPQPIPVSNPTPNVEAAVGVTEVNEPQQPGKSAENALTLTYNNELADASPLALASGQSIITPKPIQSPAINTICGTQGGTALTTDSPEWQAAREKVMAIVGTSTPTSFPGVVGAGEKNGFVSNEVSMPTETLSQTPAQSGEVTPGTSTPVKRGTGRPRGRPRGSRGRPRGSRASDTIVRASARSQVKSNGKRKRGSDDDGAEDSDDSENFTPVTTVTKSGRNITKPPQYNPAPVESPDGDTPRKKRRYKKGSEMALCVKCQRGHSTMSNMVVFCDGCNDAFHQWCHDPLIGRDVIDIPEREWFCYICQGRRERDSLPLDQRVSGQSLTAEEKAKYLRSLSSVTLADLLLRAVKLHPDLPIFAPSIVRNPTPKRLKLTMTPSTSANTPTTNGVSNNSTSTPQTQINGHETPPTNSVPRLLSKVEPSTETHLTALPIQPPKPGTFQTPKISSAISSTSDVTKPDPYPDYSNPFNDPPASYPRPGRGPIKLRSITSREDMQVLLDENFDVFSHLCNDGNGNLVPLKGSGSRAKGSSEVVRLGAAKAFNVNAGFASSPPSTGPAYPTLAPVVPIEPSPSNATKNVPPHVPAPRVPAPVATTINQKPRLLAPAPPPAPTITSTAGAAAVPPSVVPPDKAPNGVTMNGDVSRTA